MHKTFPQVWNAYPWLPHYRQPVWDGVVARQGDDYRFQVLGVPPAGKNISVQDRNYIRPITDFGARPWQVVPTTMGRLVRAEQPAVTIVVANPRYKEGWEIPRLVRRYGGVSVLWTKSYSYSRPMFGLRDWIKRRFFANYDFAIVYGRTAADDMIALGMPPERIFIAQNTIDTRRIFEEADKFAEAAEQLRERQGLTGKKILLDIGRMDAVKRHEDVLEAWPSLRELDPQLVLVLVGGGKQLDTYREMAQRIDPDRIRVIGRVAEGEDYAWIAASDATIQCGAVGLAINQSMAFGKPTVIADQIGPDTELLVEGETGWRYREGDRVALVQAVARVLRNPDERAKIAERARRVIRDEANIDNMVMQVDACIRTALRHYHSKAGT